MDSSNLPRKAVAQYSTNDDGRRISIYRNCIGKLLDSERSEKCVVLQGRFFVSSSVRRSLRVRNNYGKFS